MDGPGTQLLKLMPPLAKVYAWIALPSSKCGCKDYAQQMDIWGVRGCKQRKAQIVERLISQAPTVASMFVDVEKEASDLVDAAIEAASGANPLVCGCGRKKEASVEACFWCENKRRLASR